MYRRMVSVVFECLKVFFDWFLLTLVCLQTLLLVLLLLFWIFPLRTIVRNSLWFVRNTLQMQRAEWEVLLFSSDCVNKPAFRIWATRLVFVYTSPSDCSIFISAEESVKKWRPKKNLLATHIFLIHKQNDWLSHNNIKCYSDWMLSLFVCNRNGWKSKIIISICHSAESILFIWIVL